MVQGDADRSCCPDNAAFLHCFCQVISTITLSACWLRILQQAPYSRLNHVCACLSPSATEHCRKVCTDAIVAVWRATCHNAVPSVSHFAQAAVEDLVKAPSNKLFPFVKLLLAENSLLQRPPATAEPNGVQVCHPSLTSKPTPTLLSIVQPFRALTCRPELQHFDCIWGLSIMMCGCCVAILHAMHCNVKVTGANS